MDWQQAYLLTVAVVFVISLTEGYRHTVSVKRLSVLLGYMLLSETIAYVVKAKGGNNQFVFYFYNPIEYLFLSTLYASHFTQHRAATLVKWSGWIFFVLSVGYLVYQWRNLHQAPDLVILTEWVLMLAVVLYYFYDLFSNDYFISLPRQPMFWISIGNFFFYSGTFFLMGLIEEIKKVDYPLAKRLFLINTFLNITLYAFWAIGFLCLRLPSRNSSSSSF